MELKTPAFYEGGYTSNDVGWAAGHCGQDIRIRLVD